jgi:hypothetical protein
MKLELNDIRPFIGAKDFATSRSFYYDLGFKESKIDDNLCRFYTDDFSFYLQNYYAKEWVENTMLFFTVPDVEKCFKDIQQLELDERYLGVKVVPIKKNDWGAECFIIDPAGVLLHFGQFY